MAAAESAQGPAARLCPELIDAILQFVVWPTDLHALALLSRRWHLCATPRLYATLLVLSSRPSCTLALLLLLEADSARAACVRTVVFDETLRQASAFFDGDALSPSVMRRRRLSRPPTESHYVAKRVPLFPIQQHDVLRDVALALDRVLPALPNLRAVQMRHVHPLLMSYNSALSRPSTRRLLMKPWRHNLRSYLDIFPVGEMGTTWAALARIPSPPTLSVSMVKLKAADADVRRLERLSTRLWSRCAPPPFALQHLSILALTGAGFRDWPAAREWTRALAHMPALDALLLSDIGRRAPGEFGELVVGGFHGASRLRTLVLHRVFLQAWEYRILADLVRRHAATLETLCLDARWTVFDNGPLFDVFCNIDSENAGNLTHIRMPNLRALRIHNLAGFECTSCALSGGRKHGPAREADTGLYDALLPFLSSHIKEHALVELGITGLPTEKRAAFEALGLDLDRLLLYGGGACATRPPPAGSIVEKERWLREFFLLRGTPFEGEYWDASVPRGRLRKPHPMQPVLVSDS